MKVAQFRFAISQEGGGEHVMYNMARVLKASVLAFAVTSGKLKKKGYIKEIASDVDKLILTHNRLVKV